jgi:hypothetical protein
LQGMQSARRDATETRPDMIAEVRAVISEGAR